jgi:hypothetical protein
MKVGELKLQLKNRSKNMEEQITCPICGTKYLKGKIEDEEYHAAIEKKIAKGIIPYEKREIIKKICHNAITTNDPCITENNAKWFIAYMWWLRDLENKEVKLNQFNQYMVENIKSL